mmetsp:Transcript_73469/g.192676  ORF Transcript_73469/g.192676 Transcript_73469/m.192676 type:complete len:174 (+) Transcript_73469:103-624(+)
MRAAAGAVLVAACLAAAARLITAEGPLCNCACCVAQQRGGNLRWSEQHAAEAAACVPTFYGTPFKNEGFAQCEHIIGVYGSICTKESQDHMTSEMLTQEVDVVAFCFYECMPSAAGVPRAECAPMPPKMAFQAKSPVPPPLASALQQLSQDARGPKGLRPVLRKAARHTPARA